MMSTAGQQYITEDCREQSDWDNKEWLLGSADRANFFDLPSRMPEDVQLCFIVGHNL